MENHPILVSFCGKKKTIRTCNILKVPNKDGKLRFFKEYGNEILTKIVNDIAQKDTKRIKFYPAVDIAYKEYELSSTDIFKILRKGKVIKSKVTPTGTEMHISMTLKFRDSNPFILMVWMDLKDQIHLADITT